MIHEALAKWGLGGAKARLVAERENRVYRVEGAPFALRLHRLGYRSDAEILSELQWMSAVSAADVETPAPVASRTGDLLHVVDGVQVDMLTWLEGEPLGRMGSPINRPNLPDLLRELGRQMARLHEASDRWTPPPEFTRAAWDRAGLLGEAPLWDRFWDNPRLSADDKRLFAATREKADSDLAAIEDQLDYGLVHADLIRENVLVAGNRVQLIDFDDGGWGFRLFDLATTIQKLSDQQNAGALREALIQGYLAERDLDLAALDFFILLRALTYVGWIITRVDEPGGAERLERYAAEARKLARAYLGR